MRRLLVFATVLFFTISAWAEDITYRKHIKPIFDAKCASCHGKDSPEYYAFREEKDKWIAEGKGPRMDTYSHLIFFTAWPDTGALMRRLNDGKTTGKAGNMYQYLGSTEEEREQNLKLFKDWVGNWTLKRWKDITKEELDRIKVYTKSEIGIASKVRNVDAVVIFTNKVSHKLKKEVMNIAKAKNIPVFMYHSFGICTLRDCFSCLKKTKGGGKNV